MLDSELFLLSITNRIKKGKSLSEPGIGLQNVKRRLELLGRGVHKITNSCNEDVYISTLKIDFTKHED